MNWHLSISWKIKRDTLERQINIYQILLIMMIIEYCFLAFLFSFNLLGNDSINHIDRNFLQMSITLKLSVVWEQKKRTKRNFVE